MPPRAPITAASRRAKRVIESDSPVSSPVVSRSTSNNDAGEEDAEGEDEVDDDAEGEDEEEDADDAEGEDEEDAEGENEEEDDEGEFVSAPGTCYLHNPASHPPRAFIPMTDGRELLHTRRHCVYEPSSPQHRDPSQTTMSRNHPLHFE